MSPARGIIAGRRQYMEHALAALPAAGPTHGFHAHNSRSPGLRGPDGGEQRQVAAHLVLVNVDLDEHAVGEILCHFDERWPDALARATPCRREVHAHELRGGSQSREAGASTAFHASLARSGTTSPSTPACHASALPRRPCARPVGGSGGSRGGAHLALCLCEGLVELSLGLHLRHHCSALLLAPTRTVPET